jgi:hypothetical protein
VAGSTEFSAKPFPQVCCSGVVIDFLLSQFLITK